MDVTIWIKVVGEEEKSQSRGRRGNGIEHSSRRQPQTSNSRSARDKEEDIEQAVFLFA